MATPDSRWRKPFY